MSLYLFYPLREDGSSDGFATQYLADDREAALTAQQMLERHKAASRVVVSCGDDKVLVQERGLRAAPSPA